MEIKVIPGGKLVQKQQERMLKELIAYCEPSLEPPKINLNYHNPNYWNYLVQKYNPDIVEEFCDKYVPKTSTDSWRR